METFIIRLAVAVIPLVVLVASVILFTSISQGQNHRPLSWHRKRRDIRRAMATGVMFR